jgi:hypothetical protein
MFLRYTFLIIPFPHPLQFHSKPTVDQKFLAVRKSVKAQKKSATALQAVSSMEVAQIAGEAGYIFGVASVMFGITLVVSQLSWFA